MGRGMKCASRICALVQSFARATTSLRMAQLIGCRAEASHRHHTQIQTISVVERTSLSDYGATSSYVFAASVLPHFYNYLEEVVFSIERRPRPTTEQKRKSLRNFTQKKRRPLEKYFSKFVPRFLYLFALVVVTVLVVFVFKS